MRYEYRNNFIIIFQFKIPNLTSASFAEICSASFLLFAFPSPNILSSTTAASSEKWGVRSEEPTGSSSLKPVHRF